MIIRVEDRMSVEDQIFLVTFSVFPFALMIIISNYHLLIVIRIVE